MGKLILFLIVAGLMTVFIMQNNAPVHVRFFRWTSGDFPLALVILISMAGGVLLAMLASLPAMARRRRQLAGLHEELERLRGGIPHETDR